MFKQKVNALSRTRTPFLFLLSFDKKQHFVQALDQLDSDILFEIENYRTGHQEQLLTDFSFQKVPPSFEDFKNAFDRLQEHMRQGNTYLANLTFASQIKTSHNLKAIFLASRAKFKLYFKDQFVCFSPEPFINIVKNTIYAYPMKGTIDASIADAKKIILDDKKELAEHIMVVDLLRNDLSMVAKKVRLQRFRMISEVQSKLKKLYQVSSVISGCLPNNWHDNLGDLLDKILPAGSISGTPKIKTLDILQTLETYDRGYFTGVFGVYDGENIYSSVLIRFIERQKQGLVFKSGGGITHASCLQKEYEELIDKVDVPII